MESDRGNAMGDKESRVTVEFAPAKINLTLHVCGLGADGYHLLDSIVVFADIGDRLRVTESDHFALRLYGPFAGALAGLPASDNLVLRAAYALQASLSGRKGQKRINLSPTLLELDKYLPPAAGVGGASADAAAALRALTILWGVSEEYAQKLALQLGADVPACLHPVPIRMQGIGERLEELIDFPGFDAVLVNPMVAVPTKEVFARFAGPSREWPVMPPIPPAGHAPVLAWLGARGNDLEAPARLVAPALDEVLAALRASPGVLLARMSGSGATCFALYENHAAAHRAADWIASRARDWWVRPCRFSGSEP